MMAYLTRFVILGQPKHVIQRGNNRDVIFVADDDSWFYLNFFITAHSYI